MKTLLRVFEALSVDLKAAIRIVSREKRFVASATLNLAIGIAMYVAALSIVKAVAFRAFPGIIRQEELAIVVVDGDRATNAINSFKILEQEMPPGASLALFLRATFSLGHDGVFRTAGGAYVSTNYFELLGAQPTIGRFFNASDDQRGGAAVIGHSTWVNRFGRDPDIVGRHIVVGTLDVEIVGVAPPGFVGASRHDLTPGGTGGREVWIPAALARHVTTKTLESQLNSQPHYIARMPHDQTLEQFRSRLPALTSAMRSFVATGKDDVAVGVTPVEAIDRTRLGLQIVSFMVLPTLILLVACANAAALLAARATRQLREISMRLAVGASRQRILCGCVFEALLIAVCSWGIAGPILWILLTLANQQSPLPVDLDLGVLAIAVATTFLTGFACSIVPARVSLRAEPTTFQHIVTPLMQGRRQGLTRDVLIVAQVAVSLALLGTGAQFMKTVHQLLPYHDNTEPDRLLVGSMSTPAIFSASETREIYDRVLHQLQQLPSIAAVGTAPANAPWTFGDQDPMRLGLMVTKEGEPMRSARRIAGGYVSGDIFEATRLSILSGRRFAAADALAEPSVCIISDALARAWFNGAAIGQTLRVAPHRSASSTPLRIVGIVQAVPSATEPLPQEAIYVPAPIGELGSIRLYARAAAPPNDVIPLIRQIAQRSDPRLRIEDLSALSSTRTPWGTAARWQSKWLTTLGMLALILAGAGMYSTVAYALRARSSEIGVRVTCGATPTHIVSLFLFRTFRLAMVGIFLGLGLAAAVARIIQAQLYGLQSLDLVSFGTTSVVLVLVLCAATTIPTLRAARRDPTESLRRQC